jgi:hypothetical protein
MEGPDTSAHQPERKPKAGRSDMLPYRASRKPRRLFDPLDSSASLTRDGWRFNDGRTKRLYAAEVEVLAILELVARAGWDTVEELTVAAIAVPNGAIVGLADLGMARPANWNQRPAARNAQCVEVEFLAGVDQQAKGGHLVVGVRVLRPKEAWPNPGLGGQSEDSVLFPHLSDCRRPVRPQAAHRSLICG